MYFPVLLSIVDAVLGVNQLASNRYTYRHGKIAPFKPFALKLASFPRFLMCPLLVGNQDGRPPMGTVASLSATPTSLCSLPAAPASSLSAKPRFRSVEGSVMQGCTPGGLSTRLPKKKEKNKIKDTLEASHKGLSCWTVKGSTLFLFIINQYILYKKGTRGLKLNHCRCKPNSSSYVHPLTTLDPFHDGF